MTLTGIERSLLNSLETANAQITLANLRKSTGHMINSAADDPTSFIRLAGLQSQLSTVQATMDNVTAAETMVSGAQSAIGQIVSQLEAIRTELETDVGGGLTPSQRSESQAKVDAAIQQINTLAATRVEGRVLLDGSADYQVSGRKTDEIAQLMIFSADGLGLKVGTEVAELSYTGTDRYVSEDATFTVAGYAGTSTDISVTPDDTLEDVAQQINLQSDDTGVLATVDDNTLTLSFVDADASGTLVVDVTAGTFDVEGTGKYTRGSYGANPSFDGTVVKAATQAELVYTGNSSDQTTDAATFTLTGNGVSLNFDVEAGDNLSDIAATVNANSHETGIVAEVDTGSHTLTVRSVDYGSDAGIEIAVSAGTFHVDGGNNDGTANGTNAVVRMEGQTYYGDTVAQSAELRHREKGATLASASTVEITGHLGTQSFGFLDTDTLADVAAAIVAEADTTGVTAYVDGNDLVLVSTDRGANAEISINVTAGTFDTVSGETTANGTDATAGNAQIDGNKISVAKNGLKFDATFAAGFEGDFGPVSVEGGGLDFVLTTDVGRTATLAISGLRADNLGGISGKVTDLLTGGSLAMSSSPATTSQAIRVIDEALGQLSIVEGTVDGFMNAAITSASGLLADMEEDLGEAVDGIDLVNDTEQNMIIAYYQDLGSNSIAGLEILRQQRYGIVAMIQNIAGLS